MRQNLSERTIEFLKTNPIVAVIVVEQIEDTVPIGRALCSGGVYSVELALRSECAVEAIRVMSSEVPDLLVGAGTVLTCEQLDDVVSAGARMAFSPGINTSVLKHAQSNQIDFVPGVCTPSDIECALSLEFSILKFFPAEPCGGLPYLESVSSPFRHRGLSFIPLGGLNEENLRQYINSSLILAIGGSWIAPREIIRKKNWAEIERRARFARTIFDKKGVNP